MRFKNVDWSLPEKAASWEKTQAAILMDIRDELQRLNELLHCVNFTSIPSKLEQIKLNTTKPKARKKIAAKRKAT